MDNINVFIPDSTPRDKALSRTTHLGISAHQDDLEIMAYNGIISCFQRTDRWFAGIVVTNGSGSAREGEYASYSDDDMCIVRKKEQEKAAIIGEYAFLASLDHPSSEVKDPNNTDIAARIRSILEVARPKVVYTHNLADKHDTHVGVAAKTIAALRALPQDGRPEQMLGCEVWRDLDWLLDTDKVALDCSAHENLQAALLGVFDSQIAGGKRYDLATMGRRRAHATYHASHDTDVTTGLSFAMDLTPLIKDDSLDVAAYVIAYIERLKDDVHSRLTKLGL
jgi:LmbE family N-acetylglucosaminyl deacetylase